MSPPPLLGAGYREYPRLPWSHRPLEMQMEDAPEFFYAGDTLRSTSRSGRMGHAGLYVPHLSLSFHAFASMFCISANPQCGNNSSGARQNGWNHPGPASDNGVIVDDRPNCSLPNATEILTP